MKLPLVSKTLYHDEIIEDTIYWHMTVHEVNVSM